MVFRIAMFKAKKLFSRAKIINLANNADSTNLLDQVAELERLLEKPLYSQADRDRIKQLLDVCARTGASSLYS